MLILWLQGIFVWKRDPFKIKFKTNIEDVLGHKINLFVAPT